MASLDTHVLVRSLVEDDATAQLAVAQALVRRAVGAVEPLFVPITVMLERERVLRASVGFARTDVVQTLAQLRSSIELSFQAESAPEARLSAHAARGSADFADCLHIALAGSLGEQPPWTFDKSAAGLAGARRLGA